MWVPGQLNVAQHWEWGESSAAGVQRYRTEAFIALTGFWNTPDEAKTSIKAAYKKVIEYLNDTPDGSLVISTRNKQISSFGVLHRTAIA